MLDKAGPWVDPFTAPHCERWRSGIVKIKELRAVAVDIAPQPRTKPSAPRRLDTPDWVSPMMRYPEITKSDWSATSEWTRTACVVTAEDGTWGLGLTLFSGPVTRLINDHLASLVEG